MNIFGMESYEVLVSGMQQLHDQKVLELKKANMLTREEKWKDLSYIIFGKNERCGGIKVYGCTY